MEISLKQVPTIQKADQQNKMSPEEKKQLHKACTDFEALLTQQLLSTMRESSLAAEGLFEKSYGEKLFQSMADQKIAEQMATSGGIGFGEMLFQQLTKTPDK